MAFPTTSFNDSTNLDVLIAEIWSSSLNVSYEDSLVFAKLFWDKSDELAMGGDTLHIPNLGSFGTADTKTNATAVTLEARTETKIDLTVDTWITKAFAIEDREKAQVMNVYGIMEQYSKKAGYSVAKALETAIINLFTSFTNTVGASTTDLADSDIRAAIAKAVKANINREDLFFGLHPDVIWTKLLGTTAYTSMDFVNNSVIDGGNGIADVKGATFRPTGNLYGIPVYQSNLLPNVSGSTGRIGVLAHKEAIVFATLNLGGSTDGYKVRLQSRYETPYLSTIVVADMCYGVALNRNTDGGVLIYSKA